jgi:gas vesicle protein
MSNPNPDEIRDDIERTRAELGQDVDALADKVTPSKIAERQTRKMRRTLTSVKDRVMGVASDVGDSAHDAMEHAGEAVADAPQKVASTTRGNPIAVGLIAFGVGWLAASLIPASRAEQRAAEQAKDAAAPLLDEAKDVAAEAADHLREPAKEAVGAVKDRAAEAVETVRDEGETAASQVQSEARHTAEQYTGAGDQPSAPPTQTPTQTAVPPQTAAPTTPPSVPPTQTSI